MYLICKNSKLIAISILLVSVVTSVPVARAESEARASSAMESPSADVASRTSAADKLPNGVYLILCEGPNRKAVEPTAISERVLVNDYHFLQPTDRDETTYIVVSKSEFIPMVLSGDPTKEKDAKGRSKLLLQLAHEQITPLEDFTRKNVGKAIAIVIGGEVVSSHKVRETIVGGRMQITRCTDNGCDVIYSELKK